MWSATLLFPQTWACRYFFVGGLSFLCHCYPSPLAVALASPGSRQDGPCAACSSEGHLCDLISAQGLRGRDRKWRNTGDLWPDAWGLLWAQVDPVAWWVDSAKTSTVIVSRFWERPFDPEHQCFPATPGLWCVNKHQRDFPAPRCKPSRLVPDLGWVPTDWFLVFWIGLSKLHQYLICFGVNMFVGGFSVWVGGSASSVTDRKTLYVSYIRNKIKNVTQAAQAGEWGRGPPGEGGATLGAGSQQHQLQHLRFKPDVRAPELLSGLQSFPITDHSHF